MQIGNVVKSVIRDNFEEQSEEFYEQLQKKIIKKAEELKNIESRFLQLNNNLLIQQANVSHRSQLSKILGTEEKSGLEVQIAELEKDKNLLNTIGEELKTLSFRAYELTSEILQDLGIINEVNLVFTHRTKRTFMRAENIEIDPTKDLRLELHRGVLALRFNSATIRKKILEVNKTLNNERSQSSLEIQAHYKKFIEPFVNHSSQNTNWKPNWGVVSEAFERHWEKLQHGLPQGVPMEDSDVGTEGERWQLYKLSLGSDPYYTGPDTEFAQVKNSNATIVSNLNTILNTMEAVLKLIFESVDSQNLEKIKKQYLQAFKQKENSIDECCNQIDESISQEIQELFKQT